MTNPIERIMDDFCEAFHLEKRVETFITRAEAEGYSQLAKMFRAVVASESVRERLLRGFLRNHLERDEDYFVCPNCGLLYDSEPSEPCPIDQTPARSFMRIS